MNPYDLAWKGTTIKEKRQLLEHSLAERIRLLGEGNVRTAQLGLASSCVDIIGTATAILKDAVDPLKGEWQKLLDEATAISVEAVDAAEVAGTEHWVPSDYEVASVIRLATANGNQDVLEHGIGLLHEGLDLANDTKNVPMEVLLLGQLVAAAIIQNDFKEVLGALDELYMATIRADDLEPQVLTRAFGKVAEGAKFLAIHFAEVAGLENQKLKLQAI